MDARPAQYHRIRRLCVSGGFLDGMELELDDHLNCVIGGRGTGKTTVLEFLRYALQAMPDPQRAKGRHRDIQRLVSGNLATGQLRVEIETRDGLRYTVESTVNGKPEIVDDKGRPTALSLAHGAIFDVDVYSQNEIESIATSPSFQLDLIDRFVDSEVREIEQRLRALSRELQANASDLLTLAAQGQELKEGLSELEVVAEKLKAYQVEGGGEGDKLNEELALKGLRDKELLTLQAVRGHLEDQGQGLAQTGQRAAGRSDGLIPPAVLEGPNRVPFRALEKALKTCAEEVQAHLKQAAAAIERCLQQVDGANTDLEQRHSKQEERYRKLIAKHEEEQGKARERLHLERRLNQLQQRERELQEKRRVYQERLARRRDLIRELSELRDRRTELRRDVVRRLNERLSPQIKVGLTQNGDTTNYRDALNQAFKGTGKQYQALTQAIAAAIPPQDFVRMVQTKGVQDLVEKLDVSTERAGWVVQQLKDTAEIYAIEIVEMQDMPRIALLDGGEYKESPDLSTGQKCTTILPILLLESEKPLLIDQPEDNLDNAFIYEAVVSRIREVKQSRQLIFVTHNPNIPVLGDAGRVFVMTSTGKRASVLASGTVDDVKEHVETILEGGRDAFEARKRRYGH